MLRKFAGVCCFLLAVTLTVGQSKADLLLRLTDLGGGTSAVLNTGDEVNLLLQLQATRSFVLWNGGDVMLNTGSDSVFGAAVYLPDGAGAWTAVPPEGSVQRFFTGGPAGTQIFFNAGETYDLGTIILRAGATQGDYETFMTEVLMLDSAFLPLNVSVQNFAYSVVPEPSSMLLLGTGLCGLVIRRRRRA
jgi:hypothetical protein